MTIKQPSKPGKSVNSNAGVASVNELNTYFTNAISYAGYIVVALGIISLILACLLYTSNFVLPGGL